MCQDERKLCRKCLINAKHRIEVLINHGQVQLSKHNIDVITQKVLNIKPLNVVLVGRDRQCSIQDLNLLIFHGKRPQAGDNSLMKRLECPD